LTHAIDILAALHHQDMTIGQLLKYLHYERLLSNLHEKLFRRTSLDHDNHLWEACQSFLKENHSDNGTDFLTNVIVRCLILFDREKRKLTRSIVLSYRTHHDNNNDDVDTTHIDQHEIV
jgi:hypothetical protein